MTQENLFRENKIHTINIFSSQPQSAESKSETVNARFESTHLKELKAFCFDNDLTLSDVLRDSSRLYMSLYKYRHKIERYWEALISWLQKLP